MQIVWPACLDDYVELLVLIYKGFAVLTNDLNNCCFKRTCTSLIKYTSFNPLLFEIKAHSCNTTLNKSLYASVTKIHRYCNFTYKTYKIKEHVDLYTSINSLESWILISNCESKNYWCIRHSYSYSYNLI